MNQRQTQKPASVQDAPTIHKKQGGGQDVANCTIKATIPTTDTLLEWRRITLTRGERRLTTTITTMHSGSVGGLRKKRSHICLKIGMKMYLNILKSGARSEGPIGPHNF